MDQAYVARYRELYERHWWWRAREEYLVSFLRDVCPSRESLAILDVGCGNGLFFDRLAEFGDPEGVEPDAAMLDDGRPPAVGRIHRCRFDSNFRPGRKYGLVLMLDVVEHVHEDVAFLERGVAMLEPDGHLLVTVPAFPLLWTTHDDLNHHLVRYTRSSFLRSARRAGLRVVLARYFDQWTFVAKLLIRAKEAVASTAPRPPEIPRAWLNSALYGLTRFEQRTLGRLPLCFGSSLLVYGRRAGGA